MHYLWDCPFKILNKPIGCRIVLENSQNLLGCLGSIRNKLENLWNLFETARYSDRFIDAILSALVSLQIFFASKRNEPKRDSFRFLFRMLKQIFSIHFFASFLFLNYSYCSFRFRTFLFASVLFFSLNFTSVFFFSLRFVSKENK
jgi:hypothetical protein